MTTKHTPGPWRQIHSLIGENLHFWVLAKDPSEGSNRELQIFSVHDCHPIKEHLERRLADLKLMTASPEMLDLLKLIWNQNRLPSPTQLQVKELIDKIEQS